MPASLVNFVNSSYDLKEQTLCGSLFSVVSFSLLSSQQLLFCVHFGVPVKSFKLNLLVGTSSVDKAALLLCLTFTVDLRFISSFSH